MGMPAARISDMHTCPMVTGVVPHVGGPILPPGMPTVLIGKLPAATLSSMCTCVGPPDVIIKGSMVVLIGKKPAARMMDNTTHGGMVILGAPTVLIGDGGGGGGGGAAATVSVSVIIAAMKSAAESVSDPALKNSMNQQAQHLEAAANGTPFVHSVASCDICGSK